MKLAQLVKGVRLGAVRNRLAFGIGHVMEDKGWRLSVPARKALQTEFLRDFEKAI